MSDYINLRVFQEFKESEKLSSSLHFVDEKSVFHLIK